MIVLAGTDTVAASAVEQTRARIVAAAGRAIADVGLADVRMTTIAAEAGVSSATLHYHFDTKANLFVEVMRALYDQPGGVEASLAGLPPAERLAAVLEQCLPATPQLRHEWQLWHELWLHSLRDPAMRELGVEMYARTERFVADAVQVGIDSGDFAGVDAHEVAAVALALCDGIGLRVAMGDPTMSYARAADIVAESVSTTLGTRIPLSNGATA